VRRMYLAAALRPMSAPPLVVCRKCMIVVPRSLPAAPQRCPSRRRTTMYMSSGAE
jgi:hypothetical protein